MDEPNLQCAPKAKDFLVPMTQLPGSSSKDAHRIHTCNIRYSLWNPLLCLCVFWIPVHALQSSLGMSAMLAAR